MLSESTTQRVYLACGNTDLRPAIILYDYQTTRASKHPHEIRLKRSRPVMEAFLAWLKYQTPRVIPISYLQYLFEKFPNSNIEDQDVIDELLPWSNSLPSICQVKK